MKKTVKILWGDTKLIVVPLYNEAKADRAHKIVRDAVEGNIRFDYGSIKKKIPTMWHYYQFEIRDKEYEYSHYPYDEDVWRIRKHITELRHKRDATVEFDKKRFRDRKNNYNMVKRALDLLVNEGFVESFNLYSDGRLLVNWFTEKDKIKVDIIYPGIGHDKEQLPIGELTNRINVADLSVTTPKGNSGHGKPSIRAIEQPWYRPSIGGILPKDMQERDNNRATSRNITEELYDEGHNWRNKQRLKEGKKIILWRK